MSSNASSFEDGKMAQSAGSAQGWSVSRRSLLSAGAILGLAAMTHPTGSAFAWSSWTNASSPMLKKIGMGDCVHEDLVQISYARMLRNHANDTTADSLINPWAGLVDADDARYATIAGDIVDKGAGRAFSGADDLAARLFRENLAYLRIGSFWNDAAANQLADFGYSCFYAESVPKFSGNDYYEGAWDVGQHLFETNEKNKTNAISGLDALVQFTMNDRNNFIHGMLSSTASRGSHLKQSEIKKFALQWLGVAYEYARTGQVTATSDVTQAQAEKIFKGFIDTYGQLDNDAHDMCVSLKVSSSEASIKLPHRRLRLRALGMMCHTLEDFWCPAHTCRTYHAGGTIPKNSILAFSNYKLQNGNKAPMFGYHIPFDRYAVSDAKNTVNWREALTRGDASHAGTEKLANVLDSTMSCLSEANTYFNTLGMNETVTCITQLFEFLFAGTAWDDGVRAWVDVDIMPTFFDGAGQSYVCDAGRRGLHTPTYIISPIKSMKRAYKKAGIRANYDEVLAAATSYDAWQRGAHRFYSGNFNTSQSKYVTAGHEGSSVWSDEEGERRLVNLVNKLHEGYSSLPAAAQADLLARIGFTACHGMVGVCGRVGGMLQEFNIDLRGNLRASGDATMKALEETRAFFESGLQSQGAKASTQSVLASGLFSAGLAYADEGDASYTTSDMAVEDFTAQGDGSYLVAVRDLDSLDTSVMSVPAGTPGAGKLEENLANLSITYKLDEAFADDPDYSYIVTNIDYADVEEDVYMVTGTVKSVSADKKSLVIDMNGVSETTLDIRDASVAPEAGAYICARCSTSTADMELIGYDELDAPGNLVKVTYPVAEVCGSSVWLITNDGAYGDGYQDLLQVEYGSADVFSMPREGYYATVYYHDEAYGDVTDVDERALAAASVASGFTAISTQADDDDLNDSATTPGYIEAGDGYSELSYGNEVLHVANVIMGTDKAADDTPTGIDDDPTPAPTPTPTPSPSTDDPTTPDAAGTKPTTSAKTTTAKSTAAKTADPLAGLGGVLSVAAVAGAAFATYSARRVANEKKDAQEQ